VTSMDRFSAAPAAWYFFGRARELRRGPVTKDLLGRRLVAYLTNVGQPVVIDARCSHLSADLGRGLIVGDCIRCPFHHWEYGPDGTCRRIPGEEHIPAFARQAAYPVAMRHGLLFFFNGAAALFPLPFFFDCHPKEFVAGTPFQFVGNLPWYMVTANGFDGQHFRTVHDRRLTRPPQVDCPATFARRIRFNAEVIGNSVFDRLLRQFVGRTVDISITCWGGPMVLVTGIFPKAESYILISTQPLDALNTLTSVVVFARRKSASLLRGFLEPASLRLRRLFTQGFMKHDIDRLHGIRYNPASLLSSDRLMSEFFDWLASLPDRTAPTLANSRDAVPDWDEEPVSNHKAEPRVVGRRN
jgi:aminopyrrolnitrin oxygenase